MHGKDVAECGPFHEDKTPSCVIAPKSNLFNYFGCAAGGSVIDWVMKTQGVSFRCAVGLLKNDIAAVTCPSGNRSMRCFTSFIPAVKKPLSQNSQHRC